jgi:hypothetical protein
LIARLEYLFLDDFSYEAESFRIDRSGMQTAQEFRVLPVPKPFLVRIGSRGSFEPSARVKEAANDLNDYGKDR